MGEGSSCRDSNVEILTTKGYYNTQPVEIRIYVLLAGCCSTRYVTANHTTVWIVLPYISANPILFYITLAPKTFNTLQNPAHTVTLFIYGIAYFNKLNATHENITKNIGHVTGDAEELVS